MKAKEHSELHVKVDVHAELDELDAAEREGKLLTGAQRGRLADLRKADILASIAAMLNPEKTVETATIPPHSREHRT